MSITKLRVMYCGFGERWQLGTLAESDYQVLFEYSDEARARDLPVSPLRAPLSAPGPFSSRISRAALPGLVADSLPDGWGMLLMDRAFRAAGKDVSQVSLLDRLAVVGSAGMGALAFEPEERLDASNLDTVSLLQLAQDTQRILSDDGDANEQRGRAQLERLLRLGGSPQGARPKAVLRWDRVSDTYSATGDAALDCEGEPWLIKFPARLELPEVCAMEEAYARLARAGGMDMPESRLIRLNKKHSAFGVRRFDRLQGDTQSAAEEHRVHILSASGLLDADHRLPSLDYETLMLATTKLTGDYRETLKVFDRCVFNVLTHNRDDHAKNIAWRMDARGRWTLAPAFDLTFSFGPGGEHSTSIAGAGRLPSRADLRRAARGGGIRAHDAEARIDHWIDALQPRPHIFDDLEIRSGTLAEIRRRTEPVWQAIWKK
jgi:serine/threonine-protein kinase HipA